MDIEIFSFGHKHGTPPGSDLQLDARHLPNPYRNCDLRPLTGKDEAVQEWFARFPQVRDFIVHVAALAQSGIENEARRTNGGFQYRIGFGCTGGHHRSVYCAEKLAIALRGNLKNADHAITVSHTQHPENTQ
jgi:UPF0042 nucleotide-binding protein